MFTFLLSSVIAFAAPSTEEMVKVLTVIDDRQKNSGDYKSLVYIENKEKDKSDLVYQAVVYRRDASDQLIILFNKRGKRLMFRSVVIARRARS